MIFKIIKRTILIIASILFIVLMFLLIVKLLGYSYNKEFLGDFFKVINKQRCIETEYSTYEDHGGIEGCVFWAREYHLKTTQGWEASFVKDDVYCEQEYGENSEAHINSNGFDFKVLDEFVDLKCSFEAYRRQKRNENWDYLVSKEQDEFYESCIEKFCSWPPLFE